MQVPQASAAVMVRATVPYPFKNRVLTSITAQLMTARLLTEVREKEGAAYSIYTTGSLSRLADVPLTLQTVFQMKPEKKDRALEIIGNEFRRLAEQTEPAELDKVKEFLLKTYAEQEQKNSYWCAEMADKALLPVPVCTDKAALVQSITPEEVSAFVSEVMKQGNYRVLVMMPGE